MEGAEGTDSLSFGFLEFGLLSSFLVTPSSRPVCSKRQFDSLLAFTSSLISKLIENDKKKTSRKEKVARGPHASRLLIDDTLTSRSVSQAPWQASFPSPHSHRELAKLAPCKREKHNDFEAANLVDISLHFVQILQTLFPDS